jgi:hypothetical protein
MKLVRLDGNADGVNFEELVNQYRRMTSSEAAFFAGLAVFDRRLGWQVLGYRSAAASLDGLDHGRAREL